MSNITLEGFVNDGKGILEEVREILKEPRDRMKGLRKNLVLKNIVDELMQLPAESWIKDTKSDYPERLITLHFKHMEVSLLHYALPEGSRYYLCLVWSSLGLNKQYEEKRKEPIIEELYKAVEKKVQEIEEMKT